MQQQQRAANDDKDAGEEPSVSQKIQNQLAGNSFGLQTLQLSEKTEIKNFTAAFSTLA